ncbi:ubiquitin carboxyl-terminal hydrolase 45 [Anopheles darlingi]|uniref:ubiquitin carboxyl-terminal hydrolase 45 n=1 Tax=Anopheles darlingi TaxID=43151 RepID=UPI0021004D06|nr:ubiquitin carboxyl-terminal hydrolase 45 [Anopheles darlingi]
MGKRQRSEYKDEGASSTESNDDSLSPSKMLGGEVCSHIQKGIDLPTIRKQIKTQGYRGTCKMCDQNPSTKGSESTTTITTEGGDADNTLWLCLKCGSQLCGRNRNQHALLHYQTPRSDMHALVMNTTTFAVWCYFCNLPIEPYAKPKLLDIVEFAKRESLKVRTGSSTDKATNEVTNEQLQITTESVRKMMIDALQTTAPIAESCNLSDAKRADKKGTPGSLGLSSSGADTVGKPQLQLVPYTNEHTVNGTTTNSGRVGGATALQRTALDSLPRVRGLANLRNTCFFNAVLQCLARTPYLLPILQQSAVEGERVTIPGGVLRLADGTDTILSPIEGELDTWRSLTDALASLLAEMTSGADGVLTPKRLLHELTSKWPQFDGGDQHDSHELLRHLLESVRTDDLRRYQVLILQSLGLDKRKNQQNVDETRKAMVKFYGEQISQWVFRPEQVFRGSLVSTLTCQDCHNTSSRHEYFLDISLPVCVEKPQPPVRRKSSPEPQSQSEQPSALSNVSSSGAGKLSSKREREREKKAKRMAKHQKNRINLSSVGSSPMYSSLSTTKQANAASAKANDEEEDEEDDDGGGMGHIVPLTDVAASTPYADVTVAVEDDSTISARRLCFSDESNEPSDADVEDNDITDDPLSKGEATRSLTSPATVDQNGNHTAGRAAIGPEKLDDTPENSNKEPETNVICAVSMSAERSAQIAKQLHCLKESGGRPGTEHQYSAEDLLAKRKAAAGVVAGQRQRTYSYADWSNTIAPRYQCEDGEYSVQSCFNNFTAVELMTGNNKVTCDACTERINGKGGKDVKTNATKQYLISVPPAVLILHLKRFQAGLRGMSRKLTKPVAFPFVLDIAPFCGSKVKRAAHIRPGQKKILYALYGIVEHSGSMHGGHYVAYVKVRPSFGPDDERWKFIPQGTKDELDRRSEQEMAKEQALRMGAAGGPVGCCLPSPDSDDSPSCCSNPEDDVFSSDAENRPAQQQTGKKQEQENEEEEEEEEGAVGYRAKTAATDAHADIAPPPPGKWYHVSDSFVREVSEDTVAKVQAYLLFYERIF